MKAIYCSIICMVALPSLPCCAQDKLADKPVKVFEKQLAAETIVVTAKEIPMRHTPRDEETIKRLDRDDPGWVHGDHMYEYSYTSVGSSGKHLIFTHTVGTIGKVNPAKTTKMDFAPTLMDIARRGKMLYILYFEDESPWISVTNIDRKRKLNDRQFDSDLCLERSGPLDGVESGKFIGPDARGNISIQLSHCVKLNDKSTRYTLYKLGKDDDGSVRWYPDPNNEYKSAEEPIGYREDGHSPNRNTFKSLPKDK